MTGEFILERLATEQDEIAIRNAVIYKDRATLQKIAESSVQPANKYALDHLQELKMSDLIKGKVKDAEKGFIASLSDKEKVKLIRACHGEDWAEDALNELNDSDCLRQAARVESVKIGRLAVERLSSKADFEYVVKHGSVGNVRNLAKRNLREKYPRERFRAKRKF